MLPSPVHSAEVDDGERWQLEDDLLEELAGIEHFVVCVHSLHCAGHHAVNAGTGDEICVRVGSEVVFGRKSGF